LTVTGSREDTDDGRTFLYQGIAGRSFQRRFQLAEHVEVAGASLVNGLLNIELKREIPEAMKPRKISISAGSSSARSASRSRRSGATATTRRARSSPAPYLSGWCSRSSS
jgi:molecular chaperone IbpA